MELFIGLIIVLVAHFVADFIAQPHVIATTKHNDVQALAIHCFLYALTFIAVMFLGGIGMLYFYKIPYDSWVNISLSIISINVILHYMIDYFTSKVTHYLWNKKDTHNFFVVIGFDQLLHTGLLVVSYAQMLQYLGYIK